MFFHEEIITVFQDETEEVSSMDRFLERVLSDDDNSYYHSNYESTLGVTLVCHWSGLDKHTYETHNSHGVSTFNSFSHCCAPIDVSRLSFTWSFKLLRPFSFPPSFEEGLDYTVTLVGRESKTDLFHDIFELVSCTSYSRIHFPMFDRWISDQYYVIKQDVTDICFQECLNNRPRNVYIQVKEIAPIFLLQDTTYQACFRCLSCREFAWGSDSIFITQCEINPWFRVYVHDFMLDMRRSSRTREEEPIIDAVQRYGTSETCPVKHNGLYHILCPPDLWILLNQYYVKIRAYGRLWSWTPIGGIDWYARPTTFTVGACDCIIPVLSDPDKGEDFSSLANWSTCPMLQYATVVDGEPREVSISLISSDIEKFCREESDDDES